MKKEYIKPIAKSIVLKSEGMIADSILVGGQGDGSDEAAKDESMDIDW